MTLEELYNCLPERFSAEKAGNFEGRFQFNITGEGGGDFWVTVKDGGFDLGAGSVEDPTCTIEMTFKNYADLNQGRISGQMAFMTRKMKVKGNIMQSATFGKIFARS